MGQSDAAEMVGSLVRQYGDKAYHFAYRLCGSSEEAQDLVAEAYRRVLAHWERFDPSQPVEGWFFAILRNLYLDAAKRWERGHVVSIEDSVESPKPGERVQATLAEAVPDGTAVVEEILERREAAALVREAMRSLSFEHRAVLEMCHMKGLGYRAVAEVLGCPVGTIRSRVWRARRELRKALERRMAAEAGAGSSPAPGAPIAPGTAPAENGPGAEGDRPRRDLEIAGAAGEGSSPAPGAPIAPGTSGELDLEAGL